MKVSRISFLLVALFVLSGPLTARTFAADKSKSSVSGSEPWAMRCDKGQKDDAAKRGRCEIFQRLVVKQTNERFAEMAIGYPKDKTTARGIIVAPLGILLPAGIALKIDAGQLYKFQVRYCDKGGCYGFIDLNDAILAEMRKGSKVTVTFMSMEQKPVNVEMSLKNFSEALQSIS